MNGKRSNLQGRRGTSAVAADKIVRGPARSQLCRLVLCCSQSATIERRKNAVADRCSPPLPTPPHEPKGSGALLRSLGKPTMLAAQQRRPADAVVHGFNARNFVSEKSLPIRWGDGKDLGVGRLDPSRIDCRKSSIPSPHRMARGLGRGVTFTVLLGRVPSCRALLRSEALAQSKTLPTASRRHSRVRLCVARLAPLEVLS